MTQKALILGIVVLSLGIGFASGQYFQNTPTQTVIETITSSANNFDFVSIEKCVDQDMSFCFGSGREVFTETENVTVFNLISTGEMLRYGLVDKNNSELYELVIH